MLYPYRNAMPAATVPVFCFSGGEDVVGPFHFFFVASSSARESALCSPLYCFDSFDLFLDERTGEE